MPYINVVVHGALGKMGQEVLRAVSAADDMLPVGGVDVMASAKNMPLPGGSGMIPASADLAAALDAPHVVTLRNGRPVVSPSYADVVVDFSVADAAMSALRTATARGVNVVIGTTGLTEENYDEARNLASARGVGVIIAPNFAMGAVLMTHLAKVAARFFDYADLTEMHHEAKIDAPSGTALAIARAAAEGKGGAFTNVRAEKELIPATRGGDYEGISVHSARMPGRMAHHELVLGALGQTLTIRHDSINRESFMPGVTMAIREATKREGLTVGLEKIMGLE